MSEQKKYGIKTSANTWLTQLDSDKTIKKMVFESHDIAEIYAQSLELPKFTIEMLTEQE